MRREIGALPPTNKVTKNDKNKIISIKHSHGKLTKSIHLNGLLCSYLITLGYCLSKCFLNPLSIMQFLVCFVFKILTTNSISSYYMFQYCNFVDYFGFYIY